MRKTIMLAASLTLLLGSCSHKTTESTATSSGPQPVMTEPAAYIPKATVFKMSGPYADKVAVTVVNGQLTYFPAPGDISANSQPIYVGTGWWLNKQGISANSVFTDWTFTEYASLPTSPSPSEIMKHIIPGAEVTEMRQLTMTLGEAERNLGKVRAELE